MFLKFCQSGEMSPNLVTLLLPEIQIHLVLASKSFIVFISLSYLGQSGHFDQNSYRFF